jgi:nicotinamidase-related amidase
MHSKKALLIIDVQNDFTADNAKIPVDKKLYPLNLFRNFAAIEK